MGKSDSISSQAHDTMGNVKDEVQHAPDRVVEQTRGNPLAAGLIAFGAGLLVSSVLPSSDREGEMVEKLKEKAEPVTRELQDTAKQVAEDMKEPVKEAATELQDSAKESVEHVKQDASGEAEQLQSHAKDAAKDLSDDENR